MLKFKETAKDFIADFEKILPENTGIGSEEILSGVGVDKLLSELLSSASGNGGEAVEFFLLLLGLGLLISFADVSCDAFGSRLGSAMRSGVSLISSLLIFSRLESLVFSVGESLKALSDFFSSLIPIATGISLASGAVTTAGIQAVNMNLTLSLIGKLSSDFLMPLIFMIFALALTSSVGCGGVERLGRGVKSVFLWGLGIASTIFVASMSLQSFLATSKDNVALRAAKYALSGSIPIVGSTVSGALSTLTGALSEASAVVGVGSVGVIFTMAVSPVVMMLLYRLALSLASWVFDFVGSRGVQNSFSSFRTALDALIALYSLSAVVYILEIVIFIRGGVRVFV